MIKMKVFIKDFLFHQIDYDLHLFLNFCRTRNKSKLIAKKYRFPKAIYL